MEYFEEIGASTGYAPFVLSKMSISMSLKSGKPLKEQDFHSDTYGLELNRQTITGEWDDLYKALIEMFEKQHINNTFFFLFILQIHFFRDNNFDTKHSPFLKIINHSTILLNRTFNN